MSALKIEITFDESLEMWSWTLLESKEGDKTWRPTFNSGFCKNYEEASNQAVNSYVKLKNAPVTARLSKVIKKEECRKFEPDVSGSCKCMKSVNEKLRSKSKVEME